MTIGRPSPPFTHIYRHRSRRRSRQLALADFAGVRGGYDRRRPAQGRFANHEEVEIAPWPNLASGKRAVHYISRGRPERTRRIDEPGEPCGERITTSRRAYRMTFDFRAGCCRAQWIGEGTLGTRLRRVARPVGRLRLHLLFENRVTPRHQRRHHRTDVRAERRQ